MNYKKLMEPYYEKMEKSLIEFVSINSVYDEKTVSKEHPYGSGVDKALKFIGKLGEDNGFKVDYCDGHCVELTIGSGPKLISLFAHADVVPISGEWKYPPFECVLENGNYYGRGTSDDKGPLIASFYALIALRDNNLIDDYTVCLVVGGDEERGSTCLEYYFNVLKKPYPDYGFTPDSDFPLIYGEKGIINFYSSVEVIAPNIKSIKGGVASNAVCDKVNIEMDYDDKFIQYLDNKHIDYQFSGETITIIGKSSHGSIPENGINAALIALDCLGEFYNIDIFKNIGKKLFDTTGKSFNCYYSSDLLGESTFCVGLINYENSKLDFCVNFRHPENVDVNEVVKAFDEEFKTKSTLGEHSPHLLFDPKSKLVSTLLNAYRMETNDMTPPLTTGGGTYAKHAKNTIAFGALFPNRESTMHEPNEKMPKEDFLLSSVIYARAIHDLGKLK